MLAYWLNITQYLLEGFEITLVLLLVTTLLSIPLGVVGAITHFYGPSLVKRLIDTYTAVIRGTPLLLQLFFVMYGLPMVGIVLDRMTVAYVTFAINYTAYYIEIFRGGLLSIDKTQFEAAQVLHLNSFQILIYVILPQVFKRVLPTLANETITLLKDTALVSSIAVGEMLRNAREIVARDLRLEAFAIVALIYLITTYVLVFFFRKLEKKWGYFH